MANIGLSINEDELLLIFTTTAYTKIFYTVYVILMA